MEPATISAAVAVVGAVSAQANAVSGDSGFNVSEAHVHYPAEFPSAQFAHEGQSVNWDIIKFHAHGGFWDNDLAISASGYVSNDDTDLLGYPDSDHPNVPINRFVVLSFNQSGNSEDMSNGLLNVEIEPWGGSGQIAEGSAADPWVPLRVGGRFDPMGPGDVRFSFKLQINQKGELYLSDVETSGTYVLAFTIEHAGDHIYVYLN